MSKRVLLINITRMGDLVQMGTLLQRLQHEWPGAEVDLVVDTRFAPVAKLLPHLRVELKDVAAHIRSKGASTTLKREELMVLMLDEYRSETRDLL